MADPGGPLGQGNASSAQSSGRPGFVSRPSSSLPPTPRPQSKEFSILPQSASTLQHSPASAPRSVSAEAAALKRSVNVNWDKCKYQTNRPATRRILYSIGDELPAKKTDAKASLSSEQIARLDASLGALYRSLLPTDSDARCRENLCRKLQSVLVKALPGQKIVLNLFGSSGNQLYNSNSDVDICVSDPDLRTPCVLAQVLAQNGMQDVKCVHAKVPIVKIRDMQSGLSCDLNVNNHIALSNTELVKAYTSIEERARQLLMIVKYWASSRVLNEASGGTLSSYTWTLVCISFLQLRQPAVLPVISPRNPAGERKNDFSKDIDAKRDFGSANTETVAELLFGFLRFLAYEFDYEKHVLSVRQGKLISKVDKGWHVSANNKFCVEEPYNFERNLGNTADDTAVRGIILELRQAFERLSRGEDFATRVCERFVFPKGEPRPIFERPAPQPAVLTRSHSQSRGDSMRRGVDQQAGPFSDLSRSQSQTQLNARGGPGSARSNRYPTFGNRNPGSGGRRASSAATFPHGLPSYMQEQHFLPQPLTTAPFPTLPLNNITSSLLSERFAQNYNDIEAQKQRLEAQQSLIMSKLQQERQLREMRANPPFTGSSAATDSSSQRSYHSYGAPRLGVAENGPSAGASAYSGQQNNSQYDSPATMSLSSSQQGQSDTTNPSSPALGHAVPHGRTLERSPLANFPGTSARSQSQPAPNMLQGPLQQAYTQYTVPAVPGVAQVRYPQANYPQANSLDLATQTSMQPYLGVAGPAANPGVYARFDAVPPAEPKEYLGYQVRPMASTSTHSSFGALRTPERQMSPTRRYGALGLARANLSRSPSPLRDSHSRPLRTGSFNAPVSAPFNFRASVLPDDLIHSPTSMVIGPGSPGGTFEVIHDDIPMQSNSPLIVNGSNTSRLAPQGSDEWGQPRSVSDFVTHALPDRPRLSDAGNPSSAVPNTQSPADASQAGPDPNIYQDYPPPRDLDEHIRESLRQTTLEVDRGAQPTTRSSLGSSHHGGVLGYETPPTRSFQLQEESAVVDSSTSSSRVSPTVNNTRSSRGIPDSRIAVPSLEHANGRSEHRYSTGLGIGPVLSPVEESRSLSSSYGPTSQPYLNGANGNIVDPGARNRATVAVAPAQAGSSGWEKAGGKKAGKAGKRRGSKGGSRGEPMPERESERKGG